MTEGTLQSSGCSHGDICLVNGETVYEGRVEICINKVWGTVCSTNSTNFWSAFKWTSKDTNVVCRQLQHMGLGMKYKINHLLLFTIINFYTIIISFCACNYNFKLSYTYYANTHRLSSLSNCLSLWFWNWFNILSSIDCLGNETSLLECIYSPFHSCSHAFDVGVKCEGMAVPCTVSIDTRPKTF